MKQAGLCTSLSSIVLALDSDGEGNSNLTEINLGTQPGWCDPGNPICSNMAFNGDGSAIGPATPPAGVLLDPAPANQAPMANPGGPYTGQVGDTIAFNGSLSSDPDGDPLTYAWDFGDGSTGTGVNPTHSYSAAGTFTVSLIVNDGQVNSAPVMTTATITLAPSQNQAPTANPGGPYSGQVGQAITFDGAGSSDPDGDLLTYSWSFGDGSTGIGVSPTHSYSAAGAFTVSLIVNDGQVDSAPVMTTATITEAPPPNQPPTANPGGPYSGQVGLAITFDGSGSSDPDGDPLTYSWDFGDGSTGMGVNPVNTYTASGIYTVTLTVNDGQVNSPPATTTATITVAPPLNQAPLANPNGPYSGQVGETITFDGSGSTDPDGDPLTYAWDFGDGGTGSGVSPTHSYAAPGTYTVTLTVNDGQLDSAPATTTATITAVPVSDGQTLYNTSCAGCHGDFDNPPLPVDSGGPGRNALGARVCSIEGAIEGTAVFPNGVPAMQFLQGVFSEEQIQAISNFLNSRPVTGQQRYETTCAGCHGLDAQGGRVDEEVLGEDAKDIRKAIRKEREMRFLRCLPGSDIKEIGDFLKNLEDDDDDDDKRGRRRGPREGRGPWHGRGPVDSDDND
ncbi:MAG: PKD domain-containing protein [Acidobacteria bacterium]|nr:PKD domain-containing protein [Acidobacteriota bacterium]